MAEEVAETQEVPTDESTNEEPDLLEDSEVDGIASIEDAKKIIKKVRAEAAGRRVKNRELEEKASKWEEHLKSQMTELERITAERDELKSNLEVEKVERLRDRIALEFKLEPDDRKLLKSINSEKDMREVAARLAAANSAKGSQPNFYAGQRGSQVAPPAKDSQDWFRQFWAQSDQNPGGTTKFVAK